MIPSASGRGLGGVTGGGRAVVALEVGDGAEGFAVTRPTKVVLGVKEMTDMVVAVLFVVPEPSLPHSGMAPRLPPVLRRVLQVGGEGDRGE